MALKIKNLRLSPYSQKDNIKVIFGDELHLSFEIEHVDGESYLCALDNERILYPINRPVCAYTSVFTRDGDDVDFTLKLTTSKLRDYVSSIRKPMPVWLQIVREVNGKYETVLLDDILAIPSVIDGNMTVYEGDSFKELLDGKMDVPEAEGTAGQVLTLDADGHYSWQDLPEIPEQEQADWDESDSSNVSFIKNKPTLFSGSYNDLTDKPNLATVATSGSYNDLTDKPSIPTVNDGKITVNQGGVKKGEFTVNQNGDTTIDLNDGAQSDWDESDSSNVSFIKNKPQLATVATSGSYNDLENKPIITAPVNADWDESDSSNLAYIFNKPALATVATTGSYTDLSNKPVIPQDALDYLCFEIADTDESDSIDPSFALTSVGTTSAISLEISHDKLNWAAYTVGNELFDTIAVGNKVWIRGDNATLSTDKDNYYKFVASSVSVKASGNIMSLLSKDCSKSEVPYCGFVKLFNSQAGLLTAPELPATSVAESAYRGMFEGTGITEAPEIPATVVAKNACYYMFKNCASLVKAPSVLPAMTLAEQCYTQMFQGCTSLVEAPELPATNLAKQCYSQMFEDCTSLEKAPELPQPSDATAWASNKYTQMFQGCSKLSYIKVRMTSISNSLNWMNGVAATGVFECPAALSEFHGAGKIPAGWTVVRYDAPWSDWNQTDTLEASFIKNKPTIPAAQVQADWDESDSSDVSFIKGKPTLATVATTGDYFDLKNIDVDYLCISFIRNYATDCTVKIQKQGNPNDINIEYSYDKSTWTTYVINTNLTLGADNQKVYFRGNNPNGFSMDSDKYYYFVISSGSNYSQAHGNVMSLIDKSCQSTAIPNDYCFANLFKNNTRLTTAPNFPATSLRQYCYSNCFLGCTSLIAPCELPAIDTTLGCYYHLFEGCTSLSRTPSFKHIKSYGQQCFSGMFKGCTKLTECTETFYSASSAPSSVFYGMFEGCTNLVKIPTLNFTYYGDYACQSMFKNCSSIVDASNLFIDRGNVYFNRFGLKETFSGCTNLKYSPKIKLKSNDTSSVFDMAFYMCVNLEIAPEIETANSGYSMTFYGCSKLKYLKVDFTTWGSTSSWLGNVSANGVFDCPSTLDTSTRDASHVPANWIVTHGANEPDNDTTSTVEAMTTDIYTVCPSEKETGVLTVASALTLNAMPNASTEIAYAEVVLDVEAGATVTAGSNITFVDTPTAGKRNVCVVRWSGGVARLYVTITEDLPQA